MTCHKVSLDAPINDYRYIRGQNEYDNWHDSGVSHNAARTFYLPKDSKSCQDCHMPEEPAVLGDMAAKNRQGEVAPLPQREHRAPVLARRLRDDQGEGEVPRGRDACRRVRDEVPGRQARPRDRRRAAARRPGRGGHLRDRRPQRRRRPHVPRRDQRFQRGVGRGPRDRPGRQGRVRERRHRRQGICRQGRTLLPRRDGPSRRDRSERARRASVPRAGVRTRDRSRYGRRGPLRRARAARGDVAACSCAPAVAQVQPQLHGIHLQATRDQGAGSSAPED